MRDSRAIGVLGSDEFEPWSAEVDRFLLSRARSGDGSVLVLPTASAPEGDDVFDRWVEMGLAHYASLGIPARSLPVKTQDDAFRDDLVAELGVPSVIFFSGGNPAYLARTLTDTPFWAATLATLDRGTAFAGCSAGACILGELSPDSAAHMRGEDIWVPGLRVLPKVMFGPHWDALDTYRPGLRELFLSRQPEDCLLIAIDERTAIAGDGDQWSVFGLGTVTVKLDQAEETFRAGESFSANALRAGLEGA